jgi:CheY-like chemotaxis protein
VTNVGIVLVALPKIVLVMGCLSFIIFAQGSQLGQDDSATSSLIKFGAGAGMGAAIAATITAIGQSILKPILEERGTKKRLDEALVRITQNERSILDMQHEVDSSHQKESDFIKSIAEMTSRTASLVTSLSLETEKNAKLTDKNIQLANWILVGLNRQKPLSDDDVIISDSKILPPKRGKVLLIEDNAPARVATTIQLELKGFQVTAVGSFQEGMIAIDDAYDFALVDLMLGDGNGEDLIAEMYRRKLKTKAIVVSAADEYRLKEVQKLNPYATVQKPYKFGKLLSLLMNVEDGVKK